MASAGGSQEARAAPRRRRKYGSFRDDWVENNTIFAYVSAGGCSCCNLSVNTNVLEFMRQCSDVESSAEDGVSSPWPEFLREEVWGDRVKFRRRLKGAAAKYEAFLDEHGEAFAAWWRGTSADQRRRLFQLPLEELHRVLGEDFDLAEGYRVVLVNVARQVENFGETLYEDTTPSDTERRFQDALLVRRGAFVADESYIDAGPEAAAREDVDGFLGRFREQAKPKLLLRAPAADGGRDSGPEDGTPAKPNAPGGRVVQSFKADRRLVRLVVFRQFADAAMAGYRRTLGE